MWRLTLAATGDQATAVEAALTDECVSLHWRIDRQDHYRLEALSSAEPDLPRLALKVALATAAAGVAAPAMAVEALPELDWLAENRERFAAFRIGRFRIREPDDPSPSPPDAIELRIEAASAFGSGRHGSTEGCLRALQLFSGGRPRRVLDVGCGSGILAIAAAKLWRVPVLASDIDPAAVAVAAANARNNGVGPLVRAIAATGYRSPAIAAAGPFDLVLCNILARPLKRLAGELARHLAPGGTAILAGLLRNDGTDVLAVHRAAGLQLLRRIDVDGWQTLVVRQPGERA